MRIIFNIRQFADKIMDQVVKRKLTWSIASCFVRFGQWISYRKSCYDNGQAINRLKIIFKDKKVRNGFFKNLKYPSFESAGSSIIPKLLGSYECELFDFLSSVKNKNYTQILDIGCAEGYYVVGFALKFPNAKIFGFDIDKRALELCKVLASENNVQSRIYLKDNFTDNSVESFEHTLLLCDCEGFERDFFTKENVFKFNKTDLIIELHPFIKSDVKEYLSNLFLLTHNLSFVSSYDNRRKVFDFSNSLLGLSDFEKNIAVEEGRPFTMEWMIATWGN